MILSFCFFLLLYFVNKKNAMGNISFLIAMSFLIAILIGEKINYNNPKTLLI